MNARADRPMVITLDQPQVCEIDGCENRGSIRRGLCTLHYQRAMRAGNGRKCSIEGCGEPHIARDLCRSHYGRWRAHGDPLVEVTSVFADPVRALEARTEVIAEGCWIWTGATSGVGGSGYGVIRTGGRPEPAHRLAFEQHHGRPVGAGMELHHACRNKLCVNPAHVREVTHAEHTTLHNHERGRRRRAAS